MEFKVGDNLCDCTLIEFCGSGAYGEVWLAEDAIGTRIALKIIRNRNSYSERELNGLKNYKDCNHPNLLKIRSVKITDETIYYTMDAADDLNCGRGKYLPDTLANRLHKFGRLDGKEITKMLDGLLAGLEELHKKGLVHRDIKPDNIILVNGRATLADVSLIANDGANSLVGSMGFLSPQVLAGKPAEASDDFYALGKVIYCALTGLAVSEYPSLPAAVTISMDANLNRALRESCSHPVKSTAEFRRLLTEKKSVAKAEKPLPFKLLFAIIFIIALLGGVFYFAFRKTEKVQLRVDSVPETVKKLQEKHILQPIEITPEDEGKLEQLQNADKDAADDLQKKITTLFEKLGFFADNGKLLPVLLDYELLTAEQMRDLLWHSNRNPRMVPFAGAPPRTNKTLSAVERQLVSVLMNYTPDFDAKAVKARQLFWRKKTGNPQQLQKAMLTSDSLMQAVALDAVIRSGLNSILRNNQLSASDKNELESLLKLRYYLLTPEMYKLEYLGNKFNNLK